MRHFILDASPRAVESTFSLGVAGLRQPRTERSRTEGRHLLVITSFAGMDISFGDGPPAFFDTRVLDGFDALECQESSSWSDALAEHETMTRRWAVWADAAQGAARRPLTSSVA